MKNTFIVGLLVSLAVASAGNAANILFVGDIDNDGLGDGNTPAWAAADTNMVNHLANVLGHTVTSVDDSLVTAAAVTGADFIVVSATASSSAYATNNSGDGNSGAVNSLGTNATIVLMEGGNAVMSAFSLNTGGSLGTKLGTSINIIADDGYVTAGFPTGALTIYNVASNIGTWGSLPPQGASLGAPQYDFLGTPLASVADGGFPIQDVTTGTRMVGDNKIVVLPFHNGSFTNLNANGIQLFNNVFGVAVPEPNSIAILLMGLVALGTCGRRRNA